MCPVGCKTLVLLVLSFCYPGGIANSPLLGLIHSRISDVVNRDLELQFLSEIPLGSALTPWYHAWMMVSEKECSCLEHRSSPPCLPHYVQVKKHVDLMQFTLLPFFFSLPGESEWTFSTVGIFSELITHQTFFNMHWNLPFSSSSIGLGSVHWNQKQSFLLAC